MLVDTYAHVCTVLSDFVRRDNLSGIPDFPKSHYAVCGGVIYISSNKYQYLKTEIRDRLKTDSFK